MEITVEVTQEDIDRGKADSCSECPIALAIKRHFFKTAIVHVTCNWVIVAATPEGRLAGKLPAEAASFIDAFDVGLPVSPITFPLTLA